MIKSRERISEFGEVFTSEREVNSMLNLVSHETTRIDSRFLEPACGNGNFLIEILRRKFAVISKKYSKNQLEFERYTFQAVASVYGIDILEDNVLECRERLLSYTRKMYRKYFEESYNEAFLNSINFVLTKNIVSGDALTLQFNENQQPIKFSEWSFTRGNRVKRIEYTLGNILAYQPMDGANLFSDLGEEAFIPKPTKTYPEVNFLEIAIE